MSCLSVVCLLYAVYVHVLPEVAHFSSEITLLGVVCCVGLRVIISCV